MRQSSGFPIKVPGTTVGLLSAPSKMPGHTWGMAAGLSCPFAVYGPGTICGKCYAKQGMYRFPAPVKAYDARFNWARESMKSQSGRQAFVDTMTTAIQFSVAINGHPYFRIHDAGDFFNRAYAESWGEIVSTLSHVKFWAPTRSYQEKNPWRQTLIQVAKLPNITMRPSALRFGDPAPIVEGFAAGSSAMSEGYNCPAPKQGNLCLDCRMCWDAPEKVIGYHEKGTGPRKKAPKPTFIPLEMVA